MREDDGNGGCGEVCVCGKVEVGGGGRCGSEEVDVGVRG